jgi:hypothetical protein
MHPMDTWWAARNEILKTTVTTVSTLQRPPSESKYIIESGILESSAGDNPVVVYLGLGEV